MNAHYQFATRYAGLHTVGDGIIPAFFWDGSQPLFFDPGVSAYGPWYRRWIERHMRRGTPLTLLLTHSHFDHAGAAPYLQRTIAGTIAGASQRAATVFTRPNAIATIQRLNRVYETELQAQIGAEQVQFDQLPVSRILADGDTLDLGEGTTLEVMATPGHTRDHLSFHFPRQRLIVTGEAVGVVEGAFMHTQFMTGYRDYLDSLERIRGRRPRALAIAHNGIVAGAAVDRFLTQTRETAVARHRMVSRYLQEHHGDVAAVAERITREEYDVRPDNIQKREPFRLNLAATITCVAEEP